MAPPNDPAGGREMLVKWQWLLNVLAIYFDLAHRPAPTLAHHELTLFEATFPLRESFDIIRCGTSHWQKAAAGQCKAEEDGIENNN